MQGDQCLAFCKVAKLLHQICLFCSNDGGYSFLRAEWGGKNKKPSMQYVNGRLAIRTGDCLDLKSVTDSNLFRFIMLNKQYFSMMPDVPPFSADNSQLRPRKKAHKYQKN